jgi:hypothetical protein
MWSGSRFNDDRPLTCFAGIWTDFKGDRGTKSKPVPGPNNIYGFLTTTPNAVVKTDPPERHAGDLYDSMDASAVGRGEGAAAAVAG